MIILESTLLSLTGGVVGIIIGALFSKWKSVEPIDLSMWAQGYEQLGYDAYVYFGADTNNRQAKVTSVAAGETYSFATDANATVVNSQAGPNYVETTDMGEGYPRANFAVFRGLTGSSFDVTTNWTAAQGGNVGIFAVQIDLITIYNIEFLIIFHGLSLYLLSI